MNGAQAVEEISKRGRGVEKNWKNLIIFAAFLAFLPTADSFDGDSGKSKGENLIISGLLKKEKILDGLCRGGSGDDPKTWEACKERDSVQVSLSKRGWCYGEEWQIGAEMSWHQCTPPSVKISSVDLFDKYQENEISADNMFKGKRLEVSGKIERIHKDFAGHGYLELSSRNEFSRVQAKLNDRELELAGNLSRGGEIVLSCEGVGMMMSSVLIKDCVVKSWPKLAR